MGFTLAIPPIYLYLVFDLVTKVLGVFQVLTQFFRISKLKACFLQKVLSRVKKAVK